MNISEDENFILKDGNLVPGDEIFVAEDKNLVPEDENFVLIVIGNVVAVIIRRKGTSRDVYFILEC